jgi:tetratricopeptide (TPR) repeat protein
MKFDKRSIAGAVFYAAYLLIATSALVLLIELSFSLAGYQPLAQSDYPADPGSYVKIAVFGSSHGKGANSPISFVDVIRNELARRYPALKIYVRNYSREGQIFHGAEAEILKANLSRYDFFLVYEGTNEVHLYLDQTGYWRKPEFKDATSFAFLPGEDGSALDRLLDYHSRLYAFLVRWREGAFKARESAAGGSQREVRFREFENEGVLPPLEKERIAPRFKEDLEEIARSAERHGKKVLVMSQPSNDLWRPFFSVRKGGVPQSQDSSFVTSYRSGVEAYNAGRYEDALALLEKARAIDGGAAIVSYYIGMSHWALGHRKEAREYLDRAVSDDGHPIRPPRDLFVAAREVAERSKSVSFIDAVAVFRELVDRGMRQEELLADIQHPSFFGHILIGLLFTCKLAELPPFAGAGAAPSPCFDPRTIDAESLRARYRKELNITPAREGFAYFADADWNYKVGAMSAYAEDFMAIAEKHMKTYLAMTPNDPQVKSNYDTWTRLIAERRASLKKP